MTRVEAHRLLDRARDGRPVSSLEIDAALRATGDLDDDGEGCGVCMRRAVGTWERGPAAAMLAPASPFDGLGGVL